MIMKSRFVKKNQICDITINLMSEKIYFTVIPSYYIRVRLAYQRNLFTFFGCTNIVFGLGNMWSSMPDNQCIIFVTTYIVWQKSSAKVNWTCLLSLFRAGLPKNAWYAQSILCRVFKDLNLWQNMSNYEYFQRL